MFFFRLECNFCFLDFNLLDFVVNLELFLFLCVLRRRRPPATSNPCKLIAILNASTSAFFFSFGSVISVLRDFKYLFAVRESDIEHNDYLKSLINKNFLIRRLFLFRDYFYHKKLNLHKFKR